MEPSTLNDAAIREIERLTQAAAPHAAKIHEVSGRRYTTGKLDEIPTPEPIPAPLSFTSLQGLADFARSSDAKAYGAKRGGLFILIDGPSSVSLYSGVFGRFAQRTRLGQAVPIAPDFKFGSWHSAELFTISLLSMFAPTEDREIVFGVTGAVDSSASVKTADDGISQQVTVKRGIERVAVQIGPQRLFRLRPFATFSDVAQPERPFLLRIKPGDANAVPVQLHSCALHECDGGAWKLTAVAAIKEWLLGELAGAVPVYG